MLCVLRLVKAWPHDCLFHPFWSSAEGSAGRQFGSRGVQAWPKDGLKRPLLEKRDTSPKPYYLLGFGTVWVDLGRHWAARGPRGGPTRGTGSPCASVGAQRFNWDLWKRSQTDGNGRKWTQPGSNPSRIRGQSLSKGQDI